MKTQTAPPGPKTDAAGPRETGPGRLRAVLYQGSSRTGSLQVVIGIILIWTAFALANDRFLSPANLTNLALQIASVGTISIGVVLVLLLGEIDLSVGSVSGMCAAVMAVVNVKHGVPAVPAIVLAIGCGALVGLVHGLIVTRFGVPAFVVTIGGMITWQGAQLYVLGDTGALNITDPTIKSITATFFVPAVGWAAVTLAVAALVAGAVFRRRARRAMGLTVPSAIGEVVRLVLLALVLAAAMAVFTSDRGVPLSVGLLFGFIVLMDFVCRRTIFGRQIYAIGGSNQAATRAGLPVIRNRLLVFVLCSMFAAIGGVLAGSRLMSVDQSLGGGMVLMNAIAGAVIGGTSLFGGRGTIWAALLGAIVIGSVANGMDLLAFESSVKFMITGAVLVVAVIVDALARSRASKN